MSQPKDHTPVVLCLLVLLFAPACRPRHPAGCAADGGACPGEGCQNDGECTDARLPVCDASSGTCRVCQVHADCAASFACRVESGLPEGVPVGACYPPSMVARVDGAACPAAGADGSPAAPFCEVQDALAAGRTFLVVRPRPYSLAYQPATLSAGQVTILGPGRDATPQAVLGGLQLSGAATQAALWDLALQNTTGAALTCTDGRVTLSRVAVQDSLEGAVIDEGCALVLDRARLSGMARAAVRSTASTRHRVLNSLIVQNGHGFTDADRQDGTDVVVELAGSFLGDNLFTFNTVSDNGGSIHCRAGQVLRNSIIASAGTPWHDQSCTADHLFVGSADAPRLDPRYSITPQSDCCIDKARPDPAVTMDHDSTVRPKGAGYDIGCFEIQ